jgi:hypothetical protein
VPLVIAACRNPLPPPPPPEIGVPTGRIRA